MAAMLPLYKFKANLWPSDDPVCVCVYYHGSIQLQSQKWKKQMKSKLQTLQMTVT
jgi:hypothetical protein